MIHCAKDLWQRGLFPFSLVVLLLLVPGGCGGGDQQSETPQAQPTKTAAAKQPAQQPSAKQAQAEKDAADEKAEQEKEKKDKEKVDKEKADDAKKEEEKEDKPEEPPLPADYAAWRVDDYMRAKREDPRRLEEALAFFAESQHVGKDASVPFLVNVLKPAEPAEDAASAGSRNSNTGVTLAAAEQIIDALATNRTEHAAVALRAILRGEIPTPMARRTLHLQVLTGLAEHSDFPPFEELLYQVVTDPRQVHLKLGNEGDTGDTPESLRKAAIESMQNYAAPELRRRLAEFTKDPNVTQEAAAAIESLVTRTTVRNRPAFENLPAMSVLYLSKFTSRGAKSRAIEGLLDANRKTIHLLLGIPEQTETPPRPGTLTRPSSKKRIKDKNDYRQEYLQFARQFWSSQSLDRMWAEIDEASDPSEVSELLRLMSGIPTQKGRFLASELVDIHAHHGTRAWGHLDRTLGDPAMLVFVKDVYHSGRRREDLIRRDGRQIPGQAERTAWEALGGSMTRKWIEWGYSAARKAEEEGRTTKPAHPDDLPYFLHPDARVAAEYHLSLPQDAGEMAADLDLAPLDLHYVRIEEEGDPEKWLSRYERNAGGNRANQRTHRGGHWLDGLVNGKLQRDAQLSIDILISSDPSDANKETKPYAIDILTIEIPEPIEPEDKQARR